MGSANERRYCILTPPVIGWAYIQNDPRYASLYQLLTLVERIFFRKKEEKLMYLHNIGVGPVCWCVYMSSLWTNIMSAYAVLTAPNHQQTQYWLEASVTVFPSYINSCMQFCWASGVFQNDKWKPDPSAAHRRLIGYKHCSSIILK